MPRLLKVSMLINSPYVYSALWMSPIDLQRFFSKFSRESRGTGCVGVLSRGWRPKFQVRPRVACGGGCLHLGFFLGLFVPSTVDELLERYGSIYPASQVRSSQTINRTTKVPVHNISHFFCILSATPSLDRYLFALTRLPAEPMLPDIALAKKSVQRDRTKTRMRYGEEKGEKISTTGRRGVPPQPLPLPCRAGGAKTSRKPDLALNV